MKEPLLDPFATEWAGAARELLSDMTAPAPAQPAALRLAPEAWTMLRDPGRRGLRAARTPEGRLLRDAGLLSGVGSPTARGQQLLGGLGPGARAATVRWEGPGTAGLWACWISGRSAVVTVRVATADAELDDAPLAVEALGTSVAIARLLDAIGVGPAWAFEEEGAAPLPDALVAARIRDPDATPPEDAGVLLERAWRAGPWVAHLARREADGAELRLLRAGSTGWLRPEPVDETSSRLIAVPSAELVPALVALLLQPVPAAAGR